MHARFSYFYFCTQGASRFVLYTHQGKSIRLHNANKFLEIELSSLNITLLNGNKVMLAQGVLSTNERSAGNKY